MATLLGGLAGGCRTTDPSKDGTGSESRRAPITHIAEARPQSETLDALPFSEATTHTPCAAQGSAPSALGTSFATNTADQDANALYVAAYDDQRHQVRISRMQKDGSGMRHLFQRRSQHTVGGIATSGRDLYFSHEGRLHSVPLGEAEPKEESHAPPEPARTLPVAASGALAADTRFVYVAHFDATTRTDRLLRVSQKNFKSDVLLSLPRPAGAGAPAGFSDVALDERFVYVASSSSRQLLRIPKGGGTAQELVGGEHVYLLQSQDDRVYFLNANSGGISSVTKSGRARLDYGLDFKMERFIVQNGHLYGVQLRESDPARVLKLRLNDPRQFEVVHLPRPAQYTSLLGADGNCLYAAETDSARSQVFARGL